MDQPKVNEETVKITKPVKWVIPDNIRSDHATHLIVQQNGSEFTLLFFEIQSPILTGTPEEQLAALEAIPFVEARCVSKIVISAENIPPVAGNLIDSLNKFQARLLAMKGQEDEANSGYR